MGYAAVSMHTFCLEYIDRGRVLERLRAELLQPYLQAVTDLLLAKAMTLFALCTQITM